jgi:hypothetical protein
MNQEAEDVVVKVVHEHLTRIATLWIIALESGAQA